jgi:hypothetical protein
LPVSVSKKKSKTGRANYTRNLNLTKLGNRDIIRMLKGKGDITSKTYHSCQLVYTDRASL